ncbi:MAG: D-alanine aminotransferase [Verrucomicrobiae bacterium]|nr:D-alanine aminotransferase [Verrucomicrobiae bacterium]
MPEIACINGEFLPLEQALVHVEDRGFQFADAVYEVFRTYHGKLFAVREHLQRLDRSLRAIALQPAFTSAQLETLLDEAVRRASFPEALLYMQISRGQARRHRGLPAHAQPTLVITVRQLESSAPLRQTGVKVITVPDQRWARCDIKSVALLVNVLAYNAARQAGADDALFCDADGTVHEATAGNLFIVVAGKLITPPAGPKLLAGVTRDKIVQLTGATERPVKRAELLAADEIFLTSTTAEAVPVIAVDGQPIGPGRPGPRAAAVYEQFVRTYAGGQ